MVNAWFRLNGRIVVLVYAGLADRSLACYGVRVMDQAEAIAAEFADRSGARLLSIGGGR